MKRPYLIAEIGVNYYDTAKELNISPLEAARKYIYEAKQAGIDAVKFQSYKADTIVSKNSPGYWDMTKEPTKTQYELFQKFDHFNAEEYGELCRYSRELGIDFMSTPFDYASADYLADMVDVYKISSSDITNHPFLKYIAAKGKSVYLSVGASYLSEVEEAVRVLKEAGCPELCLMHCVLSYPCKYEDANLNMIKTLKKVFPDLRIGYSDHTLPDESMTVLTTAYLYGAEVIEKHYTLNKSLTGNDHYHAGDPKDFAKAIRNFELIAQISGQEKKEVLPCELIPRKEARRSLVLVRDMKKNEIITERDVAAKRPGTGVSPKDINLILGKAIRCDAAEDTVLTWDMV